MKRLKPLPFIDILWKDVDWELKKKTGICSAPGFTNSKKKGRRSKDRIQCFARIAAYLTQKKGLRGEE